MPVNSKLGKRKVAIIRRELTEYNALEMAIRFGVSKPTIAAAATGRGVYEGITDPPPIAWIRQRKRSGITDDQKQQIKNLVAQKDELGLTYEEIGRKFGRSAGYMHQIAGGLHD